MRIVFNWRRLSMSISCEPKFVYAHDNVDIERAPNRRQVKLSSHNF